MEYRKILGVVQYVVFVQNEADTNELSYLKSRVQLGWTWYTIIRGFRAQK